MDPLTKYEHGKVLSIDGDRDKQLDEIVARARRLRPVKKYPRQKKIAEATPVLPAAPTPPASPSAAPAPTPPAASPPSTPVIPPGTRPPSPSLMQRALGHRGAQNVTNTVNNIGQTLGRGGQAVADTVGAGNWYKQLSPFMQQWGLPVGGPLAAMLGTYLLSRLIRRREPKQAAVDPAAWLGSAAGGAGLGAMLGAAPGAFVGLGRGNTAEGLGRGVLRGAGTGAGAMLGGHAVGASLDAAGPELAALLQKHPGLAAALVAGGMGLGGGAGYALSGAAIGPPQADREDKQRSLKQAAIGLGIPDATGAKAWSGKLPKGVSGYAPYETSTKTV